MYFLFIEQIMVLSGSIATIEMVHLILNIGECQEIMVLWQQEMLMGMEMLILWLEDMIFKPHFSVMMGLEISLEPIYDR